MVKARGAAIRSPFHADLSKALVAETTGPRSQVVPWTVNDAAIIERLMDWRAAGLITDHPGRVRAAMSRRGMPPPLAF